MHTPSSWGIARDCGPHEGMSYWAPQSQPIQLFSQFFKEGRMRTLRPAVRERMAFVVLSFNLFLFGNHIVGGFYLMYF